MIVYVYSKCSTCQEALRLLESKKLVFSVKEITKEPPTVAELERMLKLQNDNIKKLLNTSGLLYREMGLSAKLPSMPVAEVFALLSQHGMLVKRPFLIGDEFGLTGFNETEWSQKL